MGYHFEEMNPDIRAMRMRRIQKKLNHGIKLDDDEEEFYKWYKRHRM